MGSCTAVSEMFIPLRKMSEWLKLTHVPFMIYNHAASYCVCRTSVLVTLETPGSDVAGRLCAQRFKLCGVACEMSVMLHGRSLMVSLVLANK
jgi:hypothetical protein